MQRHNAALEGGEEERVSTVNVLVGRDTEAQSRTRGGEDARQIFREERRKERTALREERIEFSLEWFSGWRE